MATAISPPLSPGLGRGLDRGRDNGDKPGMKKTALTLASIAITVFAGCDSAPDGPVGVYPNYLVINAPSGDPDDQWYVSDFFTRDRLWEPEHTNYNSLRMSMYELSQYPNQPPTEAQQRAADKLVQDSFDAAVENGWFDQEKGFADGFEKMFGDPVHFVKKEWIYDGITLDPEKPETLMYYQTDEGIFLMGIMYLAIGERGTQPGGPLTVWHYHIDRGMCYELGVLPIGRRLQNGECQVGMHDIRSPEMLHVWFFDHPMGKFATQMGLPQDILNDGVQQIKAQLEARQ